MRNADFFVSIWYNGYVVFTKVCDYPKPRFRSAIRYLGSDYLAATVRYISLLEALTSVYLLD